MRPLKPSKAYVPLSMVALSGRAAAENTENGKNTKTIERETKGALKKALKAKTTNEAVENQIASIPIEAPSGPIEKGSS